MEKRTYRVRWTGHVPETLSGEATYVMKKMGITSESEFVNMAFKKFIEDFKHVERIQQSIMLKPLK